MYLVPSKTAALPPRPSAKAVSTTSGLCWPSIEPPVNDWTWSRPSRRVGREALLWSPVGSRVAHQAALPLQLFLLDAGIQRQPLGLSLGQVARQFLELQLLFPGRRRNQRVLVAEVPDHAFFLHVVEVREELVVLLLRQGIELVIVAARTPA